MGYLAAVLRQHGYDVDIIDAQVCGLDMKETADRILKEKQEIIGFSASAFSLFRKTIKLIEALRSSGVDSHFTIGGNFPTFEHRNILQKYSTVDSIVRGEGEFTFLELVQKIARGEDLSSIRGLSYREGERIVENPPRGFIKNLDELPFPARDTLPLVLQAARGNAGVCASRGCYGNCSFCSIRAFYGTPLRRMRSPKNVVDEIEILCHKWGVKGLFFVDDVFVDGSQLSREWVRQFHDEILSRRINIEFGAHARVNDINKETFLLLRETGLRWVDTGIESGAQKILDRMNKMTTVDENRRAVSTLEELGLKAAITFIMFEPDMTLDEAKQNYEFLTKDLSSHYNLACLLRKMAPYSGTPIRERLIRDGRLDDSFENLNYTFLDPQVQKLYYLIDRLSRILWPATTDQTYLYRKTRELGYRLETEWGKIINIYFYRFYIQNLNKQLLTLREEELTVFTDFFRRAIKIVETEPNTIQENHPIFTEAMKIREKFMEESQKIRINLKKYEELLSTFEATPNS